MPKLEIKRRSELTRAEAAQRIIAIGQALARGSEVEFEAGDDSVEVVVADHVRWELEIEVDGDETEIEIEISWRDDPVDDPAPPAAKPARRARARKPAAK